MLSEIQYLIGAVGTTAIGLGCVMLGMFASAIIGSLGGETALRKARNLGCYALIVLGVLFLVLVVNFPLS